MPFWKFKSSKPTARESTQHARLRRPALPAKSEWDDFGLDVYALFNEFMERGNSEPFDEDDLRARFANDASERARMLASVAKLARTIDFVAIWPFMGDILPAWLDDDREAFMRAKLRWDVGLRQAHRELDSVTGYNATWKREHEEIMRANKAQIERNNRRIEKGNRRMERLEREIEESERVIAGRERVLAANSKKLRELEQFQLRQEAAEAMMRQKFVDKVVWSAARHAFMATFTAGLGNAVLLAWDAMDATELASTIADLSDTVDTLQSQSGGGGSGPRFGSSQDVPLAGGGIGNYDDHGNLVSYPTTGTDNGKVLSKWDRKNF